MIQGQVDRKPCCHKKERDKAQVVEAVCVYIVNMNTYPGTLK